MPRCQLGESLLVSHSWPPIAVLMHAAAACGCWRPALALFLLLLGSCCRAAAAGSGGQLLASVAYAGGDGAVTWAAPFSASGNLWGLMLVAASCCLCTVPVHSDDCQDAALVVAGHCVCPDKQGVFCWVDVCNSCWWSLCRLGSD
jgi:hypothetical protein